MTANSGFQTWWKSCLVTPPSSSKGSPYKNLYTKSRRVTLRCRGNWAWYKRVKRLQWRHIDTTEENTIACNMVGPSAICTGSHPSTPRIVDTGRSK
jgi:hypothetical protein